MKRIKILLGLGFALALAILASNALASSDDFKNRFQINLGTNSADLLTVSKDRFVITLDWGAQSLSFIDTWNWTVSGSLSLGGTVNIKHMAISPSQTTLYLASDNGAIQKIDLSPLDGIQFGATSLPALTLEPATTVFSGNTLLGISVISPTGSTTVDCLFGQLLQSDTAPNEELDWAILEGASVFSNLRSPLPGPLPTVGIEIEVSAGPNVLLAKHYDDTLIFPQTFVYAYRCAANGVSGTVYPAELALVNATDHFLGIAMDQNHDKFVIGDAGNPPGLLPNIALYTIYELMGLLLDQFELTATETAIPLMLNNFASEPEPVLFFAEGDTLNVLELASDTAFGEVGSTIGFSGPPRNLADSSSADGFVYASLINSSTVDVITPNPFVSGLSTSGTVTSDTITLTINYDKSGPRPPKTFTVAECPVFSISPAGCSRIIVDRKTLAGTGTEIVTLTSQEVGECSHILGVFVQDGITPIAHQGRNAIQVSVDIPPPAQGFDLGFWDQTIVFEFTAQDLCDLASFEIHYGDSPTSPPSDGAPGNPPSPKIISPADPGKDYRIEIKGLVNGTVYYGQIITKDQAGNSSASEIKQTMPQPVKNYTDIVHEKGGFSCAVSPGASAAPARTSELALLLSPLMILLSLVARRNIGRLFSARGQAFRGQTPPNQNKVKERKMRLENRTWVMAIFLGLWSFAASAQEAGPQETEKKPNPLLRKETEPRSLGSFQIAYQQYYPSDSAQRDALNEIFDQDYFQMVALSFGVYPLRNLGINFNVGFSQPTGNAVGIISGATSDAEITLTVVPLQLEAVYRFDFVDEQFFIPVIGGGGDYWYYDEETEFGSDTDHVRGNKSGYHALAGVGILLDGLDPTSRGLKEWGIENVFLEIEARMAWLNSGDGIDFTGTGYSAGLLFEF